jgi:hypothetical protein
MLKLKEGECYRLNDKIVEVAEIRHDFGDVYEITIDWLDDSGISWGANLQDSAESFNNDFKDL